MIPPEWIIQLWSGPSFLHIQNAPKSSSLHNFSRKIHMLAGDILIILLLLVKYGKIM